MSRFVQVLELRQFRCSNRFGVSPCTAAGDVKCFQTFHTCEDKANFNLNGQLRWYFTRHGDPAPVTAALPGPNQVYAPTLPILQSVSTKPIRINVGAIRENESPFGLRGTISVTLNDFEFRNQFGDFYASEREVKGSLARLMLAWLGEAAPQLEMYLYTGEAGQALVDMTVRRYDVTNISPPQNGTWEIEGIDPLAKANRRKAKFPRSTDIRLLNDLSNTSTNVQVFGAETDISDVFGNTGSLRYIRFNSEIISYTGYTGSLGTWTLTGVTRGALATEAAEHDTDNGGQRVGHFSSTQYWKMAYHVLSEHTTIPTALIDYSGSWLFEGEVYRATLLGRGTYIEPTDAEDVVSEMMRDGLFHLWWDEKSQLIKMQAMRQPTSSPQLLTERGHIVKATQKRAPDERMTRVTIYYNQRSPVVARDNPTNYNVLRQRVDGTAELPEFADGTIRDNLYYSRLMRADYNAILVGAVLLQRYINSPLYLSIELAYKDAELNVGDYVKVESYEIIDTLGNPTITAWQVIEWEETDPGFAYKILLQSFILYERPAFVMADTAPFFDVATDAQKINAGYIAQNDGTMPDGSAPYLLQ